MLGEYGGHVVSLAELKDVVEASLDIASDTAMQIQLGEAREVRKRASMLQSLSPFSQLTLGSAVKVWTVILFVDMRSSTLRALEVGPKATYLTMHALLPALAHVVKTSGGYIVGFRGDGLFAAFGIDGNGTPVPSKQRGFVVGGACVCGLAMIEAVQKVVNPALVKYDVAGDVRIGVGVDAGEVVITRIGLSDGFEVTAYGDAVNSSAKLCGQGSNEVIISDEADEMIPVVPNGTISTLPTLANKTLANKVLPTVPRLK